MRMRLLNLSQLADKIMGRKNRRTAPRARSRNLIKYQPEDGLPVEKISNLIDFSEIGLQFVYRKKIRPGSILKMVVNVAERNKEVPVLGRVMWVKALESRSRGFRIGVAFLEIQEEDRKLLRGMIKSSA